VEAWDPKRERQIVEAALELPTERRTAYIDEACGDDADFAERVRELIAAHEHAEPPETRTAAPQQSSPGDLKQIGPYRLLEKLGEGGMGEVWLADQHEPIRRKVALKIIKPGMDSKQVVARFEAERQALAMMDHPSIAKVYDAGATPAGRPYFVMEHVKGVPITEHCDRHKLTNQQRLELFVQVCEGVQHAHQKAVIHRDLKPGNVLISVQDGNPLPKIIDFGVAKATAQKLTDKTMHTQLGMLIGTLEYMSPEQAEMTGQDVDTRADVYALGVVLYELLVGALPFDPAALREVGLEAIVRKIREDEPPKPSTRLGSLGEHSTESARRRRTNPPALKRELSGDLDWITMKALEKDRTRRYASPLELAADIRRYLTDQPVLAGPPSAMYRARKFVKRNTVVVVAASVVLVMLIVFAVAMAVQAGRIASERDRANLEARAKGQVSDFMKDLFTVSDPAEARGGSITARELLDRGAEKIGVMLVEQPDVGAELAAVIGEVYRNLGLYEEAEPLLDQYLATSRELFGDAHPNALDAMEELGALYYAQGRYDDAEPFLAEVNEVRRRDLGQDHPDTLNAMANLAALLAAQGRHDEAEALGLETLEGRKRVLGEGHEDTVTSMNNLGTLYAEQGRYKEAEPLFFDALESRKRSLGEDHPSTLRAMSNLAIVYKLLDRYDEALTLLLEAIEIRKRVSGDDHPDTLAAVSNLANAYADQQRYDEAEPLFIEALEGQKRKLGHEHPVTLISVNNLALMYQKQGRYDDAEPLYRQALEGYRRLLGDGHPRTTIVMGNLGSFYLEAGHADKAAPLLEEAAEHETRIQGRRNWSTAVTIRRYGASMTALGRYDEAEANLLEAHEILTETLGADNTRTQDAVSNLVDLYEAWGKRDRAAAWRAKLPPSGTK